MSKRIDTTDHLNRALLIELVLVEQRMWSAKRLDDGYPGVSSEMRELGRQRKHIKELLIARNNLGPSILNVPRGPWSDEIVWEDGEREEMTAAIDEGKLAVLVLALVPLAGYPALELAS